MCTLQIIYIGGSNPVIRNFILPSTVKLVWPTFWISKYYMDIFHINLLHEIVLFKKQTWTKKRPGFTLNKSCSIDNFCKLRFHRISSFILPKDFGPPFSPALFPHLLSPPGSSGSSCSCSRRSEKRFWQRRSVEASDPVITFLTFPRTRWCQKIGNQKCSYLCLSISYSLSHSLTYTYNLQFSVNIPIHIIPSIVSHYFKKLFSPKCPNQGLPTSVTRFGEISPLWPNVTSLWRFFDGFRVFGKICDQGPIL